MSDTVERWKHEARQKNETAVDAISEAVSDYVSDRRHARPDWSLLRFVVRTRGRIFGNSLTVAAFLERSRAEEFAAVMNEHDEHHPFAYTVEEVAP